VKVHGTDVNVVLKTAPARAIASLLLPEADAIVAVSRALAEELAHLGVPRDRLHVVPNGVDPTLFHPRDRSSARLALGVPGDADIVLFVGRLEPQKGVHELLDAFERVRARAPRALLVLAGDGVDLEAVRARVSRWAPAAVRLLGATEHARVAEWMSACDVLALPSWAEGTPNVVLEALASGRPVVATRVGGIPDVLRDERAGILVPPRDVSALADALATALYATWDEEAVLACGPRPWRESAGVLRDVLQRVMARRTPAPSEARAWA
jgi:glycosyltransferase involved in cell wall biosynthesis